MAIAITSKDWIPRPKAPTEAHGHCWCTGSSKMELEPGDAIHAPNIGLLFLWVKRYEKKALEWGYTLQKGTGAELGGGALLLGTLKDR